jgi:trimeric autotransporter adhesin
MSLTGKKTAELNTSGTIKAAQRARTASSAAAANAASAAQNAAVVATNAAQAAASAAQNAAVVATNAAQNAGDAAQTAAISLRKGVNNKVYTARTWAAPRLEDAADYTSDTVAPTVSAALRATARQVSPQKAANSKKTVLTWTVLGTGIAAAVGAAATVARYRYRAAIAADSETADEEVLADSSGGQAAPATPDTPSSEAEKTQDENTETSVDGRVPAPGK